ncbi:LacI family DNA-binding transcriptional regulator [Streptomyces sp. NPDC060209]|uniref:LacI family DNA-binding transcriptional regulator n=1 Tax=Streptomyces sp. NPDC060209 TaxID=3347073 RepID=UPI003653AD0C
MGASGRVTLNDVAAASGVSRATVSFVLNDDPKQTISASTRDRVKQAAKELGYAPHGVARALREGNSRLVVLTIDWGLDGNYARTYIRGLDDELAAHHHVLLVRHGHQTTQDTQQILDAIAPRAIFRFGDPYFTGHDLDDLGRGWRDGLAAHTALQIQHLVEHGHTRIGLALPDFETPLTASRLRFTGHAAVKLGIPAPASFVAHRNRSACAHAVEQFLADTPGTTAIAGFNDDIALRSMTALQDLGLSVPHDVAVIGYDDTEYGELVRPSLTTVHIDAEAHGRLSARLILRLDDAGLTPVPAQIIVRESV